jgi:hypothetical protein
MFQFPRLPRGLPRSPPARAGFPHSGTPGSAAVCASPGTIAACRALLRLPVPRHPPCALAGPLGRPRAAFAARANHRIVSSLCGSQGARGEPRGPGCRGGAGRAARAAPRGVPPGASRLNEKRCVSSRSPPEGGLPRKEVIQPHVPVRLPCYDFTPLAAHTFGASAPFGFGRRLRVQETRVV